ncbi:hypothetical protein BH09PSE1_BH09PSE1_10840 [soil metagenome]
MRAIALAAALMLAGTTPGFAQSTASTFTVRDAAATPQSNLVIDGASWRCGADKVCTGTGGLSQPAPRACRRVVAKVGAALASFTYKGVTLTDEQLTTCNAGVA